MFTADKRRCTCRKIKTIVWNCFSVFFLFYTISFFLFSDFIPSHMIFHETLVGGLKFSIFSLGINYCKRSNSCSSAWTMTKWRTTRVQIAICNLRKAILRLSWLQTLCPIPPRSHFHCHLRLRLQLRLRLVHRLPKLSRRY